MIQIVVVSHGDFCTGMIDSYHMIAGENELITAVKLDEQGIGDFSERLAVQVTEALNQGELLILTDIKGGTPYNEGYNHYLQHPTKIKLVTGMNLPMLIEVGLNIGMGKTLEELYELALTVGREAVMGAEEDDELEEIEF